MGRRVLITEGRDNRNSLVGREAIVFVRDCESICRTLALVLVVKIGIGILLCSGHSTIQEWDVQDWGFGQIVIQRHVQLFAYQRFCNVQPNSRDRLYRHPDSVSYGTLIDNKLISPLQKCQLPLWKFVAS
jgi:hypothetical protein